MVTNWENDLLTNSLSSDLIRKTKVFAGKNHKFLFSGSVKDFVSMSEKSLSRKCLCGCGTYISEHRD